MVFRKVAALASAFAICDAQLLPLSSEDIAVGAAMPDMDADVDVEEGFVNPTICDPSVKQTAGFISTSSSLTGNSTTVPKYFFWLFESKSKPAEDPLIMWLSGGPGCSSQLALLAENGPCSVKNGRTQVNPYSWHQNANVMWVDQPAGVGFSTGFGTHNEKGVAENMLGFLQGFYKQFPSYQQNKFFIFGESYAGHYVPAIGHRLWQSNKEGAGFKIPLAGLGIGNGLTNPEEQYKWYPEFGANGCAKEGGHAPASLNPKATALIRMVMPACTAAIHECNKGSQDPDTGVIINATACLVAFDTCNMISQLPIEFSGLNPYDVRIKCEKTPLCYDFDPITDWLNTASVQAQLGVSKKWGSCNRAVDMAFSAAGDWMTNYHMMLPELLNDGIEVLLYAGEMDYLCNFCGNKAWALKLDWDGKDAFNKAEDADWSSGGKAAAKKRSAQGFHFMQIYNAGHLVPMDQPAAALDMVNRFIAGNLGLSVEALSVSV